MQKGVIVTRFIAILVQVKIKFGVVKLLDVPQNGTDVPMWDIL